jgi:ligand-binding sensor domain-containing protein
MQAMRHRARAALLCCLFCLSAIASGQQLPLHAYTQTDGLENLAVNALVQDPDGYLWIGTENGLYRYDGMHFQRFGPDDGLPDPTITALHVDPAGRLWVGTEHGLYLLRQEHLVPVLKDHQSLPIWPGSVLTSTRDGRLLAVSKDQLVEIRSKNAGASWEAVDFFSAEQRRVNPQLTQLFSVHADSGGDLWMGCDHSLCHYDGARLTVLDASYGVPEGTWDILARNGKGQLWARSEDRIIASPASTDTTPLPKFLDRTPPSHTEGKALHLRPLVSDTEGRILAGTSSGVMRWNGTAWETFDADNGLRIGGGVNAILVGREGELWLGALGSGLIRWVGYAVWENWTVQEGLPGTGVWSFHRDRQGLLHIGTKSGMAEWRQDLHRFSVDAASHEGATHQRGSIVEDTQGNLWSSTFTGLLIRQDAQGGRPTVEAHLPPITQILVDWADRLWIATAAGLYLVEHPGGEATPVRMAAALAAVTGRDTTEILGMCEGQLGTLWLLTPAGLLRLDGAGLRQLPLASPPTPLPFHTIACSKTDDTVWLGGSNGGIWRVRTEASTPDAVNSTPAMLQQRLVFALYQDSRGWLWATADYGVAVWNGTQWRVFDQQSGLVWNDGNAALYEDGDGSMWIGTSNGASHVLKPERLFADVQTNLVIERITRNETVLSPGLIPHQSHPLIQGWSMLQAADSTEAMRRWPRRT